MRFRYTFIHAELIRPPSPNSYTLKFNFSHALICNKGMNIVCYWYHEKVSAASCFKNSFQMVNLSFFLFKFQQSFISSLVRISSLDNSTLSINFSAPLLCSPHPLGLSFSARWCSPSLLTGRDGEKERIVRWGIARQAGHVLLIVSNRGLYGCIHYWVQVLPRAVKLKWRLA